jgi:uncharacterized tellurite resistance protein B-like protein
MPAPLQQSGRMSSDLFEQRRKGFETEFFAKQEQQLLEKLRLALAKEHPRETLKKVTGIQDDKVIETLVALNVNHDTLAAFALYPLVEVAWADGKVDQREREAFFRAAAEIGLAEGTPGHFALKEFLKDTPREEARKAWFAWSSEVNKQLEPAERKKVREALLQRARAVAEATGGFLGLGTRITAGEQRVLDRIAEAFAD